MPHRSPTAAAALLSAMIAAPGRADVIIENFTGPDLDEDLWSVFDLPLDGVTIEQANDRLEWSSTGNPGRAGIFGAPWSIDTDDSFEITIDYNLSFGNPGATTTGLNIALYSGGTPSGTSVNDRFEISIFRWGSLFWYEWALFANGSLVSSDFRQTTADINRLEISYNAFTDSILAVTLEGTSEPIVIGVGGLVAQTGAADLQLYMGGFMNGITIAVDGSDAWWDTLRVEGTILDEDEAPGVLVLDARDDAAWFRRGTSAGERFAHATRFAGDVNGDGISDVIVGAPRDGTAGNNAGAATVYSGADGTQIMRVLGAAPGAQLGFAVDGAGDFDGDGRDDVIVGAGAGQGAAFVYSGMPPHAVLWSQNGEAAGDRFGYSVAGVGDVNNDGLGDVIVGAPFSDQGGPDAGRAYVYLGGGGTLWHRKTGTEAGEQFGRTVSDAGDVDDDGDPDYIVGAPLNDRRGPNSGQVSIYSGRTGARLLLLREGSGDRLGWSAAAAGDVNGDGHDDVVVGAINDDTGAANAGAALVYSGFDGARLYRFTGIVSGDRMGETVAGVRDLDGDGVGEIAAASSRSDFTSTNGGRVWIWSGATGVLLAVINGESGGDQFGTSLDGDQRPGPFVGIAVGAWMFTSGGLEDRGSAYRYELVPAAP